ncbi:MAG TPA: sensor domain-containing diguanylate cyclase [Thermoanaerobaculia bacterium]|nr:sensor domain-containing diguanylate cyclase [Thermoanaerobaculia bacterium]HPA51402.1 sensor domain-containing diguanylate cyclase [Thermoanaerobaculia bacterium]HQN07660.1 sensor domain-containing diguanylate cyclase [Thermoanaerobaculia bacterium]HQP86359.1 sensor domain-containing diguanylate cyclase [Thermoanaerobaculia bacterium]
MEPPLPSPLLLAATAAAFAAACAIAFRAGRRTVAATLRQELLEAERRGEAIAEEGRLRSARLERANAAQARRAAALERVLRATPELRAHLPLDSVLRNTVQAARKSLGHRQVLLSLHDRLEGTLVPRAHVGLEDEWPSLAEVRVPAGPLAHDLVAPETAEAAPLRSLRRRLGLAPPVAMPLAAGSRVVGLLELAEPGSDAVDVEEDRVVLDLFALQAVQAVRLARAYRTVRLGTLRDALTGVANHGSFQETLRHEIARHERSAESLVLLMVDLDDFKAVNDRFGHPVGDAVLRGVVSRLLESVREMDVVARYGGEEFAVVLPQTDAAQGSRVAERLRAAVAAAPLPAGPAEPLPLTVSIGLAVYPEDGRTKGALVECADRALYAAKRTGKNRVVRFTRVPAASSDLRPSLRTAPRGA